MKRSENYWWLIGVNLGEWNYNGMYWQVDPEGNKYGNNQYEFIHEKNGSQMLLNHKEFIEYISAYDLSEYKKSAKH